MFFKILGWALGFPLFFVGKFTNNYVISMLLFVVVVRILYIFIDRAANKAKMRANAAVPFIKQLDKVFFAKKQVSEEDRSIYERATLKIYEATKTSPITRYVAMLVPLFIITLMFIVISNPLTYFYGCNNVQEILSTAGNINSAAANNEILAISVIKNNPTAFISFNLQDIISSPTTILGIDLMSPATSNIVSLIIPALWVVMLLTPMTISLIKRRKSLKKSDGIKAAALLVLSALIISSSFIFPLCYYLAILISNLFSLISSLNVLFMGHPIQYTSDDVTNICSLAVETAIAEREKAHAQDNQSIGNTKNNEEAAI